MPLTSLEVHGLSWVGIDQCDGVILVRGARGPALLPGQEGGFEENTGGSLARISSQGKGRISGQCKSKSMQFGT